MTLQYRGDKAYYYRSVRRDGKPVKEYVAAGAMAELVADVDRQTKERRQQRQEAEQQSRERLERADASIVTLEQQSELLVHAALYAAGYHRHKRKWRLKRGEQTEA